MGTHYLTSYEKCAPLIFRQPRRNDFKKRGAVSLRSSQEKYRQAKSVLTAALVWRRVCGKEKGGGENSSWASGHKRRSSLLPAIDGAGTDRRKKRRRKKRAIFSKGMFAGGSVGRAERRPELRKEKKGEKGKGDHFSSLSVAAGPGKGGLYASGLLWPVLEPPVGRRKKKGGGEKIAATLLPPELGGRKRKKRRALHAAA